MSSTTWSECMANELIETLALTVDGMAEIEDVAKAIEQVLAGREQQGARASLAR